MRGCLAVLLCLTLCGCGKEKLPQPVGYVFHSQGVDIAIGMDADVVESQLGACTPVVWENGQGGNDYEYVYEDYTVFANDRNGFKEIYRVVLTSDLVKTGEDISIGDTTEDVTGVYGAADRATSTALVYQKGGMELIFTIKNDLVHEIQYQQKSPHTSQ